MSLNLNKIIEIKQMIKNHLSQEDFQSTLNDIVTEITKLPENKIDERELLKQLNNKGILDKMVEKLKFVPPPSSSKADDKLRREESIITSGGERNEDEMIENLSIFKKGNIDSNKRYLLIKIFHGRAFTDELEAATDEERLDIPEPGFPEKNIRNSPFIETNRNAVYDGGRRYFSLHVEFRGQRSCSGQIVCSCEPDFDDLFLFEINPDNNNNNNERKKNYKMADTASMLPMNDCLHFVLTRTDSATSDCVVLSSLFLDWRDVLVGDVNSSQERTISKDLEFYGIGMESQVPVGLIRIKLDLIPRLNFINGNIGQELFLRPDILSARRAAEKIRRQETERAILNYGKQWWKEYLQIRSDHSTRNVKIFAKDEKSTNRLVCHFIRPIACDRLLDSPLQAARFVSLIGYEKSGTANQLLSGLGAGFKTDQWLTTLAFLSQGKGDCENHALLLCSLLLGFGLSAYVGLGTRAKGIGHAWVITLSANNYGSVIFWESLTGQRYDHKHVNIDETPYNKLDQLRITKSLTSYPYRTIGCLFGPGSFYANVQPSDSLHTCSFDLKDQSKWKSMSHDTIIKSYHYTSINKQSSNWSDSLTTDFPHWLPALSLTPPRLDNQTKEAIEMEIKLRRLIQQNRKDQGLMTSWDHKLSGLLAPALYAYEMERLTGVVLGNDEFEQTIRSNVADSHTFKAFPVQYIHTDARLAFIKCLKSNVFEEIVNCRGDQLNLGLRVRIFGYPERTQAVWIMFACKYKSVL